MAYTSEIKEQVLKDLASGVSAGKISRTYQISIPTIYNWKNKYLGNLNIIEKTESTEEDKTVESTLEPVNENMKETDENQKSLSQESKPTKEEEVNQTASMLMQEGSLEKALSVLNHPLYKDDADILFKKANILISLAIKDNDIEKAKEAYSICENPNLGGDKRFVDRIRTILDKFPVLKREVFPILKMSLEELMAMPLLELSHQLQRLNRARCLKEVLNICNNFPDQNNSEIIMHKARSLFYLGRKDNDIEKIKESYELCQKIKYKINLNSIIQKIEEQFPNVDWSLYQPAQTEEILNIENPPSHDEFKGMPMPEVNKQLRLLIDAGNLEEVVDIIDDSPYRNNPNVALQKVKALFCLGKKNNDIEKIKDAYRVCLKFESRRRQDFQQHMKKIESAFPEVDWSLCQPQDEEENIRRFPSHDELREMPMPEVNKQLRLLIDAGNLEEVVDIIDDSPYRNNPNIALQKVKALFCLGKKNNDIEKMKEAYRVCLKFESRQDFQQYMKKIESAFPEVDWSLCQPQDEEVPKVSKPLETPKKTTNSLEDNSKRKVVTELLMKIHCDFITTSEIENAEIDAWYKDLLILALTHKKSRENALSLVKKLKGKYCKEEKKVKILNKLLERIKIKRGINFDVNDYIPHLPASFDYQLLDQILEKKALKESREVAKAKSASVKNLQVAKPIPNTTRVCKKPEKRMIVVQGKSVTARYQQLSSSTKEVTFGKTKKLKIKDIFESEISQIGKQLYIQMRDPRNVQKGCEAWDRLEALKEKDADDLEALRSIISLIDRINLKESDFIKTNDQRNGQLLTEAKEREKQKLKK